MFLKLKALHHHQQILLRCGFPFRKSGWESALLITPGRVLQASLLPHHTPSAQRYLRKWKCQCHFTARTSWVTVKEWRNSIFFKWKRGVVDLIHKLIAYCFKKACIYHKKKCNHVFAFLLPQGAYFCDLQSHDAMKTIHF